MFLRTHQDHFYFSPADLLKLFKGFESMVQHVDDPDKFRTDLRSALIKMTLNLSGSGDEAFLELMKYYE